MTIPVSTYRIQFRNGMTFERATALIPYLKRLGISHLYASPIFTATEGSTHGYDVADANEIDPDLGGSEGFEHMSDALRNAGLGLIIDIVPNHMAASLENAWWRSVVEWGAESPFSRHFDIDWSRRLTLPILGQPIDKTIEAEELSLVFDAGDGVLAVAYYDNRIPLSPASYLELPIAPEILELANKARPGEARRFHEDLRTLLAPDEISQTLQPRLSELSRDRGLLRRLLDRQPWQLLYWQDAPRELSYRRFFEVTGLAGLRVEDAEVFEDSHRLILDLVRSGRVDGLRIDHIDGLADPRAYLDRLRQAVGDDVYIVVEKILASGEALPADWPISGTTGYEFISALTNVFVDPQGMKPLSAAYNDVAGSSANFPDGVRRAKQQLIANNFAVEANNLLGLLADVHMMEEDSLSKKALKSALDEILIAFPVYRTYGTQASLDEESLALWRKVIGAFDRLPQPHDRRALAFIDRAFRGDVKATARAKASEFRRRLQQLTGPLTAKSIEDTMFYRFNRLLALNEVGGEAEADDFGLENFHRLMDERAKAQPHGLSATSTHDTKRGEDARARLYAISEVPGIWAQAVQRWREMNRSSLKSLGDGPAPDAETEWMVYQALAGVWPSDLENDQLPKDLEARFIAYLEKALREAKQRTNWTAVNEPYENAVKAYARSLLSPRNSAFLTDFQNGLRPFIQAGLFNSLTQSLIKLAAPGVSDIYQGAEGLDFSLVDPDNRREPDFRQLEEWLTADGNRIDGTTLSSGALKQYIVARGLQFRRENAALFLDGSYEPLQLRGEKSEHAVAFLRRRGDELAVAVAPRMLFGLRDDEWPAGAFWRDTALLLPASCRNRQLKNALTGEHLASGEELPLARILDRLPVALLGTD
jgi:(1->4)-alpha-D-glucan 1-alpha-D-glucosylmutase